MQITTEASNQLISQLTVILFSLILGVVLLAILVAFTYMILQWLKNRKRQDYALSFVTLLVKLPKDNEIKIDAAEQMFAGLYSLNKSGFSLTRSQDIVAFEIVALKEEIAFYRRP